MSFRVTAVTASGQVLTYQATGDRAEIEAAAYDNGAMGLTVIPELSHV